MSIYGFWQGPTYRPSTRDELFGAALEQPMSAGATFWDQAKGGVLESFGLGTAIRTLSLPPAAQTRRGRETDAEYQARQERVKGITEEEYKASPYFRENVPWDSGMTEDRAAALATMHDAKRVREYFAEKRPITSFFGNLAGQATDPINYIPVAGPSVKAAAVARMGVVKGIAATAALDAAANTAIAGLVTRETRRSYGDDVSWQMMVSEIATAALLGTAFGTVGGLLERRAGLRADALRSEAEVKVNTLRATQEARIALNEAIGGLANDGEVRLSPNAVAPIERAIERSDFALPENRLISKSDLSQPNTSVVRSDASASLDQIIEAEILKEQRSKFRESMIAMREKLTKLRDDIPPETLEALDNAIARNDAQGWNNLRAEIDVAESSEGMSDAVNALLTDFDLAFNTPAARASDYGLAKFLREDYEAVANHYRTMSIPKLADQLERDLVDAEANPVHVKALEDVIEEKRGMKALVARRSVDASPARPEPPPAGRAEAEAKVAKPENYKALADQYRVDPEAGTFPEEAELRQLAQAGRLSDEDMAVLDDADGAFQDGVSYGEALRSVVGCLV